MNDAIADVKREVKSKPLFWNNIESRRIKASLMFLFLALIVLKIFTTVVTFGWLAGVFN